MSNVQEQKCFSILMISGQYQVSLVLVSFVVIWEKQIWCQFLRDQLCICAIQTELQKRKKLAPTNFLTQKISTKTRDLRHFQIRDKIA